MPVSRNSLFLLEKIFTEYPPAEGSLTVDELDATQGCPQFLKKEREMTSDLQGRASFLCPVFLARRPRKLLIKGVVSS